MSNNNAIQKKYIDNDKMQREQFAKMLVSVIDNHEIFKRDDDYKALTIAIDAPWGTGKSYFIHYLSEYLGHNYKNKYNIVNYNAWEKDFWENAFDPIVQTLTKSDVFWNMSSKDYDILTVQKIGKTLLELGKSLSKNWIANKIGEPMADKLLDIKTIAELKNFFEKNGPFAIISELEENIDELKKYLDKVTRTGNPIVFLIDELDRCKPSFAISTLEIIKHIIDVDKMVFIFAIDIEQLRHSVRAVYGEGMDSIGYLHRFFDLVVELPSSSFKDYIEYKSEKSLPKDEKFVKLVISAMNKLSNPFGLTARDVNLLITNMKLLYFGELCNLSYDNYSKTVEALLNFLCIKIKVPLLYKSLLSDGYDRIDEGGTKNNEMMIEFERIKKNKSLPYLPFLEIPKFNQLTFIDLANTGDDCLEYFKDYFDYDYVNWENTQITMSEYFKRRLMCCAAEFPLEITY